jgi:hypothetical protein
LPPAWAAAAGLEVGLPVAKEIQLLHRLVRMGLSALVAVETVEQIEARLAQLVLRRQRLRELSADVRTLERNRQAIVGAQWELSHALIARYLPAAA